MRRAVAVILVCASARAGLGAAVPQSRSFAWEQANSIMCGARERDDYLAAVGVYDRLAAEGACNGPLFYDAGTALLQAGRPADALKCLLRAERYLGNNADVRRNMKIAVTALEKDASRETLPWYRPLFFWHYNIAGPTRMTIAVTGFACLWFALGLRLLGLRRAGARIALAGAILLVVFGSSAATTWHAEATAPAGIVADQRATPAGTAKETP